MNTLKVLSLFDGLSGAQVALNKLGVICDYYSSEIDNYAIQITQKNFPDTIQLGNILQFFENPKDILNSRILSKNLPCDIDLLIGGSPCTDLSVAKNNGKGLEGEQSRLFWTYVGLLNYYCQTQSKPFYFVFENVASMKTKDFVIITNALGVEPVLLDAQIVSAQRRKRYYWTNIPEVKRPQIVPSRIYPNNKIGLVIADILEDKPRQILNVDSERFIKTSYGIRWNGHHKKQGFGLQNYRAENDTEKAPSLTAYIGNTPNRIVKHSSFSNPQGQCAVEVVRKSFTITPGCVTKNHALIVTNHNSQQNRAFLHKQKHGTLPASRTTSKTNIVFEDLKIEKLTWKEIEKLAGLPIGYTDLGKELNCSEHRGRAIGNGFQIDIVAHLLNFMLKGKAPIKREQHRRLKAEQLPLF